MEKQGDLQAERDMANGLFAWLQMSDGELSPPPNDRTKQLLSDLSLTAEDLPQLRMIINSLETPYALPLRLHLSGFEELVIKQLDHEGVLDSALSEFRGVCQETISRPAAVATPAAAQKRRGSSGSRKAVEPSRKRPALADANPTDLDIVELSEHEHYEEVTEADIEKLAETRLDSDLVKQYLREIGKFKLLDAEQEVMLSKGIEAGLFAQERLDTYASVLSEEDQEELEVLARLGRQYKETLINSNLRLVVSITKRYVGRGMHFLDLIQEGNAGLVRAVEKFDYTMGNKFSTYATWWIRQAATRALADRSRTVRLPVHVVEVVNKIARFEAQFQVDTGREPTHAEIARELAIDEDKVLEIKKAARPPVSIHMPVGDSDSEFGDLIEDADQETNVIDHILQGELGDKLNMVLDTLSEREALVLCMRFGLLDGEKKSLEEIGKRIGLTKERVRQIEAKTLSKLRHPSRSHLLVGLRGRGVA